MVKDFPPSPTDDSNQPEPSSSPVGASGPESQRPKFVGDAMAALLRSADVKVQRGEETRVMSRPQELLADLERRNPTASDRPRQDASYPIASSHPPRPRVDTALWIVLAIGLFAIAGWMLAYSL